MSEPEVEQSSSSDKSFSVMPKPDHPGFPEWQNLVLLFEHLITLLDLDQNV
jgi:hypothetical protein